MHGEDACQGQCEWKEPFRDGSVLEPLIRMRKDDAADEESTAKSGTLKWRDDE